MFEADGYWLRRHDRRVSAMFADPECVGDLLLTGLVIARWLDFTYRPGRNASALTDDEIEQIAFGPDSGRAAAALVADIRRYSPTDDPNQVRRCDAPFDGSAGSCVLPVKKKALLENSRGEGVWIGSCLAHSISFNTIRAAHGATPIPVSGTANAGGVLARYLPEIDWPVVYRALDEGWRPAREAALDGGTRPLLLLIRSAANAARPDLRTHTNSPQ